MPHLLTIIGARPQFIKAAMVSRAIIAHNRSGVSPMISEEIIHTGQHYDRNMSDIFFNQMQIPKPVVNLQAGNGSHGEMTGRMLASAFRIASTVHALSSSARLGIQVKYKTIHTTP